MRRMTVVEMARLGGLQKSDRKTLAVRANGRMGGRPKGSKDSKPRTRRKTQSTRDSEVQPTAASSETLPARIWISEGLHDDPETRALPAGAADMLLFLFAHPTHVPEQRELARQRYGDLPDSEFDLRLNAALEAVPKLIRYVNYCAPKSKFPSLAVHFFRLALMALCLRGSGAKASPTAPSSPGDRVIYYRTLVFRFLLSFFQTSSFGPRSELLPCQAVAGWS